MPGPAPNVRFTIKRGDTLPVLICKLRESPNNPMDLNGVATVLLTVQEVDTGELVIASQPMTLESALDARYRYAWPIGGLPRAGRYQAVVRLTWGNGQRQTLPTKGYVLITVESDLT